MGPQNGLSRKLLKVALATSLAITALLLLGPVTGRYRVLVVKSASMAPAIPTGSLVVSVPADRDDVAVGDVISYRPPDDAGALRTHRVVQVIQKGPNPVVVTKGDANPVSDPVAVRLTDGRLWRMRLAIPWLGSLVTTLSTTNVRLAAVAALVLGLLLGRYRSQPDQADPRRRTLAGVGRLLANLSPLPLLRGLLDRRASLPRLSLVARLRVSRARPASDHALAIADHVPTEAPLSAATSSGAQRVRLRRRHVETGETTKATLRRKGMGAAVATATAVAVTSIGAPHASAAMTTSVSVQQASVASSTLAAPTGLGTTCHTITGVTGVDLTWTAAANATGYTVYRRLGAGVFAPVGTVTGGNTTTYRDVAGIVAGTYTYRLQSTRSQWTSADSGTSTVVVTLLC